MKNKRKITLLLLAVLLTALPSRVVAQTYEFRDDSGIYRVEYIPHDKPGENATKSAKTSYEHYGEFRLGIAYNPYTASGNYASNLYWKDYPVVLPPNTTINNTRWFTANFDLTSEGRQNEVCLNMCEARGCGDRHCRVVAERRDVTGLEKQDWLHHREQAYFPVHNTPEERTVKEGQILRNGKYTNAFGEEKSFDWAYNWVMMMGWVWSIQFPLVAMGDMCEDDDEFERLLKIVFSIAGKNEFIDFSSYEGLRDFLGVPHDIDKVDSRIMGSYIKTLLDCQLVPCEFTAFEKDETRIHCDCDDFVGRYEMAPLDELVVGYEAQWNGAVKTLLSPEFSVWFEGVDTEDMEIVIGKKIDNRMM